MDDCATNNWFESLPTLATEFFERHQRPLVTVSYAQSVDGSIASRNSKPLRLSGNQSMILTHRIRSACDAIIIGINTLLIDNPQLTVRLVKGSNPQPIVLDSRLRTPLTANLLDRTDQKCWLACLMPATDSPKTRRLTTSGAEIIPCRSDRRGRVDLADLLFQLGRRGIRSIMVEGGGQVITSFIESRLVDQMIITIAPHLVGGLPLLNRPVVNNGSLLRLDRVSYQPCGQDVILWGRPNWQETEA